VHPFPEHTPSGFPDSSQYTSTASARSRLLSRPLRIRFDTLYAD
jgi:hypothetical protein